MPDWTLKKHENFTLAGTWPPFRDYQARGAVIIPSELFQLGSILKFRKRPFLSVICA